MKKYRIAFWTATGLLSAMMLMSAFMYLTSNEIKGGFVHLGFPDYFRVELAVLKFLGVVALLLPMANGRVKEWAYFGFFVIFVSAFIAHFSSGDPGSVLAGPVFAIVLLGVSYFSYRKVASPAVA